MKFLFFCGHAHLALDEHAQRASGGAELQVALLAQELIARGHTVTLVATDTGQEDHLQFNGIKVRVAKKFHNGSFLETLLAIPSVIAILSEEKPQIVAIYGWTAWLYLFAKWKIFFSYYLLFVCALDSEIDRTFSYTNRIKSLFFQRGMHLCDLRFAITEYQRKLFAQKRMSSSVTRLLIQRNQTSAPNKQRSLNEKSIDLLWVARCHPIKQPLLFLELAEQFPQARCQMICSKQDEKLWNRLQEKIPYCKNMEFLESVPYQKIQSYFDRAKIFINTSLEEGVPNTFIHAGLGKSAVVSLWVDPDGMFSQFQMGGCAEGNKNYFFEIIHQLLNHPELLSSAQEEATRFINTWHNNEKNIDAFLQSVETFVSMKARRLID